jgi:hypothetical protein
MGKKAKFKKLRRLASEMPVIKVGQIVGERISGAELYKSGVEKVEDKPVNPHATYTKKKVIEKPLNHTRQMKRMYNKHGIGGVREYVQAVQRFVESQKVKQEPDATAE